jgi:hypothetical protein
MWRVLAVLCGVGALVGAALLVPSPLPPVHTFVPSITQLVAARRMTWTTPRQCSSRVPGGEPDQIISRSDNDALFTFYSGDYVQVDATVNGGLNSADYNAVFSPSWALCGLNSSSGFSQWTCYTQHPGMTTIYFPAPSTPLAIVEVKVISGGPPSPAASIALTAVGLGLITSGVIFGPIRRRRRTVPDLLRADDAQRAAPFDTTTLSRKAWDEFDKRPGPGL